MTKKKSSEAPTEAPAEVKKVAQAVGAEYVKPAAEVTAQNFPEDIF